MRTSEPRTEHPVESPIEPQGTVTRCVHCDLPLTDRQRRHGDRFCCRGCEAVYHLIHEEGLSRYYDLRSSATAPPPELRTDGLAWLDRLLDDDTGAPRASDMPRHLTLDIQGVHCAACVWLLQTLFRRRPGGLDIRINPVLGKADLIWTPGRFDLREYVLEAARFGYRFGPSRKRASARSSSLAVRLGICVAAAMNVMIFTLTFYLGLGSGEGGYLYAFFGWVNFGLATLTVVVGGSLFIRSAIAGLRRRVVHLDLPIALGITLAYLGSVYALVRWGPDAAYFDTVTIFVALMLVGRWLQERVLERNRRVLLDGDELAGLVTRRYADGRLRSVPVTEVGEDEEIWVVPGDLVPVEGQVLDGPAAVSLDWITGESEIHAIPAGGAVPAGAFNAASTTLRLRSGEPFEQSRLNDLLRRSATDPGPRPDTAGARWWHRVGTVYVTAVLLLALGGFLTWAGRDGAKAIEVTIAILVVSCPCALGLATPLAHELTYLALRKRGVFVRRPDFLDKALSVRKVIFDKTGTVTLGRLVLTPDSRDALSGLPTIDREALYRMVVRSNHPISRALADTLTRGVTADPALPESLPLAATGTDDAVGLGAAREVVERVGHGLEWEDGTHRYRLGRPDFVLGTPAPLTGDGASTEAVFAVDGHALARFVFDEEMRPDAPQEIHLLEGQGYEIHLLSGDRPGKVARVAGALGLADERAAASLTPEEKAARVAALDEQDTLMVGDGLNDALSFDAAFCAATPAIDRPTLPAKADFYFLGEGLVAVRRALLAGRNLRRIIRGNLALAVGYNTVALALCYAGVVTPLVAAILMPVSSVAVVSLTTWRLTGRRLSWMF